MITGFAPLCDCPNHTFGISRNTNFKYLNHRGSLMLDRSHPVEVEVLN